MRIIRSLSASALGAAGIIVALALPLGGQGESAIPDLDPAKCASGPYVIRASSNPGLVSDCRALVAIRNHWTRHPDNADLPPNHPLRTWGTGNTANITDWDGISVENNRVRSLYLGAQGISHTIPPAIGQLTSLSYLSLFFNNLQGSIPTEIGNLTRLKTLELDSNSLTGNIPKELGNLTRLRTLTLDSNELTGSIPPELANLENLNFLHLNSNYLTGNIPRDLGRLTNLGSFLIGGNNFNGKLPVRLSRLFPFDDGLELVLYGKAIRDYIASYTEWDVWICDIDGPLDINEQNVINTLNTQISPYYRWISRGRYVPTFSFQGIVNADNEDDCWNQVDLEDEIINPTIIFDNGLSDGGIAGPSTVLLESGNRLLNPSVGLLGGTTIIPPEGQSQPRISTIAHEMGHMLTFPHSYGGLIYEAIDFPNEYDNPMDIMSGPPFSLSVGTIAFNRYVAGWIDPEDVRIYNEGTQTYSLNALGNEGTQMLVIRDAEDPTIFYTLGARVSDNFDRNIPKEGIEAYRIDQNPISNSCYDVCWGIERRTQPFPAGATTDSTEHVYGVGDIFTIDEIRIEITKRAGDSFTVRVEEAQPTSTMPKDECTTITGRFCDEDGSVHEANIETIAGWGITLGCGNNRFCPDQTITRSQMAAFLYRAVTRQSGTPAPATRTVLNDVSEDAWYRAFVEWAVSAGVMKVFDGLFDPGGEVTRGDMAEMMVSAFTNVEPSEEPQGVFTDMTGQTNDVIRAAEGLRTAQVTLGCSVSPLRYCPDQSVTRAQMASFFARALAS